MTPKKPKTRRSSKWPSVRTRHLEKYPTCAACGEKKLSILNVHHVVPVHIDPSRELDPDNLITLCEGEVVNCHILIGHLMNWKSYNVKVRETSAMMLEALRTRPLLSPEKSVGPDREITSCGWPRLPQ